MAEPCNLERVHFPIGLDEVANVDLVIGKVSANCFRYVPDPPQAGMGNSLLFQLTLAYSSRTGEKWDQHGA